MAKAVTLKNNNNEEVYPVTDISLVNGELNGVRIVNASVGSDKLTSNAVWEENIKDGVVTAAKIDWSSIASGGKYSSSFTTTSSTMTDKITITGVPKGKYFIRGYSNWCNYDGGANGECNMRLVKIDGGNTQYSDIVISYLPAINWASIPTELDAIWAVDNDNTTIKMQTSVNWPARGTYYNRLSWIILFRVGELNI